MKPLTEYLDLFAQIRAVYLDAFAQHLAQIPDGTDYTLEAELVSAHGLPVREGLLQAGLRLDVVQFEDGRGVRNERIGCARFIGFDPFRAEQDGICCHIAPFTWDMVQITVKTRSVLPDWLPLRKWLEVHFRENEDTGTAFSDCIHFLSDPEPISGGFALETDLGSAPADALPALIDALVGCGMTEIAIGGAT